MLSLVNYGSSDSEDNVSDEEEVIDHSNGQNGTEIEENQENATVLKLPQPINQTKLNETIQEEEDEFLHKKEVPQDKPPLLSKPAKQKVKIMIPKLSDFKDDDEDDNSAPKYPTAPNRKTGLLNMLPKPSHSSVPTVNKSVPSVPLKPPQAAPKSLPQETAQPAASSSNSQVVTKKIGLIPYALMDHSKKATADDNKKSKRKPQDSDDSDEESSTFFSFDTKEEDLPKVSEDEIKAMISKEATRLEERKKKAEEPEMMNYEEQDYSAYYSQQQEQSQIDKEALKALVGGTKAKRAKVDDIQILDISENNLIDKDEFMRRNLAGETNFIPTGKIDEKGPALAKRKHQISYLSMRAEKNMSELEAMWAANRQTNREARSKYGF